MKSIRIQFLIVYLIEYYRIKFRVGFISRCDYVIRTPAAGTGSVVATGFSGNMVRTDDGGANWTTLDPGTGNNLHGISFTDSQTGTAVGTNGTIIRTTDGGQNWSAQESGGSLTLLGVHFSEPPDRHYRRGKRNHTSYSQWRGNMDTSAKRNNQRTSLRVVLGRGTWRGCWQ